MPTFAAPSTVTVLRVTHAESVLPTTRKWKSDRGLAAQQTARFFESMAHGTVRADLTVEVDGGDSVAATGTLTLATATGTVGGIINGVTITVTASGGDAATATALAAAITASTNPLVQGMVTASAVGAVVTLTSARKGLTGNTQTLAATGTGATASGARLAGGLAATTAGMYTLSI